MPATAAAAKPRPNLVVAKLQAPATLTRGAAAAASDTTANTGGAKAARSVTVYLLSADAKRDKRDIVLARRTVVALKPRKRAAGKVTLAAPAAAPAGRAFVLACADGAAKVKERNERDNCRLSAPVTIVASVPPPSPGPGPGPGPQPSPGPSPTPTPTSTPIPAPTPPAGPLDDTPPPPAPDVASDIPAGDAQPLADATKFLYTGPNPTQRDVQAGAIAPTRAAVVRGRVLDADGHALAGAIVKPLDHAELGYTATRADGTYDLAVNGGGTLTLAFSRPGFLELQRTETVPWQDFTDLPDVVLTPLDGHVTDVDPSSAAAIQVATGAQTSDQDGTRQATLMFERDTDATMTLPDGSTKPLNDLDVRATEYTVGADGAQQMPGALPDTSAYTYAVEFSVDQAVAAGATDVRFDKPVITYVDDFLGFPAGTPVPAAYYDKAKAAWVPSDNGVVIKVLSTTGGTAAVDVDGDGLADSGQKLAALGIDAAELQKLATEYPAGRSLWRVAVTHFTPWDYNWPYGCEASCPAPHNPEPPPPSCPECQGKGSIVGELNQTLGEAVEVPGTNYTLHYTSARAAGYKEARTLRIPLSGGSVPALLRRIDLTVSVAGRRYTASFPPTANQATTYSWDGKDAYGRTVDGQQMATVDIGYVYDAVYLEPVRLQRSFAQFGNSPLSADQTRQQFTVSQRYQRPLGRMSPAADGLGGWTLDAHHAYDPQGKVLWRGDGTQQTSEALRAELRTVATGDPGLVRGVAAAPDGSVYLAETSRNRVVKVTSAGEVVVVAGGGDPDDGVGDGLPAKQARLSGPSDVALAANGTLYVSDTGNARVRAVGADGRIRTVAGGGRPGELGDDGPATGATLASPRGIALASDGTLYIADSGHARVRRVTPDGHVSTAAGDAALQLPVDVAVGADGTVYVADPLDHRVRAVGPDGTISTLAGPADAGDPYGVAVSRQGAVYFSDRARHQVRRVDGQGVIERFAGTGTAGRDGDGGAPGSAQLQFPEGLSVAPDGALYVADTGNHLVRRAAPSLPGFANVAFSIPSDDGEEVYVFDDSGRHLRTLDGWTGATLLSFAYDQQGRLASVTDGDGNVTQIQRASDGTPTAIVAPGGLSTPLTVDGAGRLASIDGRWTMAYSSDGLLERFTDPAHHDATFEYDALGRLAKDTDVRGHATTFARQELGDGMAVTRTSPLGLATRTETHRSSDGTTTVQSSGPAGLTASSVERSDGTSSNTGPDGSTATIALAPDPRWGMLAPYESSVDVRTPGGRSRTLTQRRTAALNDPGDPFAVRQLTLEATIAGEGTSRIVYDGPTRTATLTSGEGRKLTTTYDATRRPVSQKLDGAASAVTIERDARGRPHTVSQGSRSVTYAYGDAAHPLRVTAETDADGDTTALRYDATGTVDRVTPPGGHAVGVPNDASGRTAGFVMPGGGSWTIGRDALGNLTSLTAPGGSTYTGTYDDDGKPLTFTLPGGRKATASYDALGRLTGIVTGHDGETELEYAGATERVTRSVRRTGGHEDQRIQTWDGPLLTSAGSYSYDYDDALERSALDLTVDGTTYPTPLTYDQDGLLTGYGPFTLERRGAGGQVSKISDTSLNLALTYDAEADEASRTLTVGGTQRYRATYGYDLSGRLSQKVETLAGATHTYAYAYDPDGRLTSVQRDGAEVEHYAYDADGNRTSGGATYDAQDRLQAPYVFDADGMLSARGADTFHFSSKGELQSATAGGTTVGYAYDSTGRRTARFAGGQRTDYFYGDPDRPYLITASRAGDGTVTRYYYAAGDLLFAFQRGASRFYVATDQVGSPRVVTDVSGAVVATRDYDAYGVLRAESNPAFELEIGFAGGLADAATGLVRFGRRDYDPAAGRFVTRDPLFQEGGLNLYEYAASGPVDRRDPSGLDWSWQGVKDFASQHWQKAADWVAEKLGDESPLKKGWERFKKWKDWLDKGQEAADEALKVKEALDEPDKPHQAKALMKCILRNLKRIVPIDLVGTDAAEAVLDKGAEHMENQHYDGTVNGSEASQLHQIFAPGEGIQ